MRKILLTIAVTLGIIGAAQAQKVTTRAVDNKGTIRWVLDSTTSVIINAKNGITKSGDTVKLGGTLTETTTIATSATQFLQLTGLQSGSRADSVMMVNNVTGQIKKMSVADLMSLYANNGLTKVADSIQLGGNLTKATTIGASATNTLAVTGLQSGSTNDSVVVADATTGVLKRISLADAVKANNGVSKSGDTVQLGGALTKATTVTTTATNTLAVAGLQSGSTNDSVVVADPSTGALKRISLKDAVKANNGLTKSGDTVKLGGSLIENTNVTLNGKSLTFTTSASDSMKIENLRSGNLANDSLVVADGANGTLRRVSAASLLTSGEQIFTATAGLTTYTVTNLPAQVSRVWVYRNGVKLVATTDYTVSGTTLTLNPGGVAPDDWAVLAGDKIEVQWVK